MSDAGKNGEDQEVTENAEPDYTAMALQQIGELEKQRGIVAAERSTCEAELYDMDPASPEYDPYQLRSRQHDRPEETADLSAKLQALSGASGDTLRAAEAGAPG